MPTDLASQSLAALAQSRTDDERAAVLRREQRAFLARPDAAAMLARTIAETPKAVDLENPLYLLAAVLDDARMAHENRLPQGTQLLDVVAAELEDLNRSGNLTTAARFALAQAYVRAGLEPPNTVKLTATAAAESQLDVAQGDIGLDLGQLLDRIRAEVGGDGLQLHMALSELLAPLPADAQAVAITEIAALPQAGFSRLGTYWLLNQAPEVRQAAAAVFLGRARTGNLTSSEQARLVVARKWLPADGARALVDEALREVLRKGQGSVADEPPPWKLHRVSACLPDGAGSQSVVIAAQQGKRRAVLMLLLKAGHGVKDAFLVPCASAGEQKRLLAEVVAQTDPLDVDLNYVRKAVSRALGEGAALDAMPAPGLLDVFEVLGGEFAPLPHDTASVLADLDRDGTLAALSAQKRGRLIGESASWPHGYDLIDSWFEDTGEVRELLDHGGSLQAKRNRIWCHLETRREWWAMIFARVAAVMQAAPSTGDEWQECGAVALALLEGRPVKKIPIMETIVAQSIEASDERRLSAAEGWHDDEDLAEPFPPVEFASPEPAQPSELETYLATIGLTPPCLEGFLVAVAVAPKFQKPNTWLGPLLARLSFADHAELQRFLDLLMARMNATNVYAADEKAVAAILEGMTELERREWASGFTEFVAAHPAAWPKRGRTRDDQAVLAQLERFADDGMEVSVLGLIGAWVSQRHARRR